MNHLYDEPTKSILGLIGSFALSFLIIVCGTYVLSMITDRGFFVSLVMSLAIAISSIWLSSLSISYGYNLYKYYGRKNDF